MNSQYEKLQRIRYPLAVILLNLLYSENIEIYRIVIEMLEKIKQNV